MRSPCLLTGNIARSEPAAMHHLVLQRPEETLDNGIVKAVAAAAQAGLHALMLQAICASWSRVW